MKVPAPAKSDELDGSGPTSSNGSCRQSRGCARSHPRRRRIDWPIADAPVKWTNVRMVAEVAVSVTAQAIDWPIAGRPCEVDQRPHGGSRTRGERHGPAIEWPIAEAPVTWTNVRMVRTRADRDRG